MFETRELPSAIYARLAPEPTEVLHVGTPEFDALFERRRNAAIAVGQAWPIQTLVAADIEGFGNDDISALMYSLSVSIPSERERRRVAAMWLGPKAVAEFYQRVRRGDMDRNARDANYRAKLIATGEDPEDVVQLTRPGTGPARGSVRAMERRERRLARRR